MNLENLKAFQSILAAIGLSLQAVQEWVAAYEAAHPDSAGMLEAFLAWLSPKLDAASITALANGVKADLVALAVTGKGPIPSQTAPTDFA